MKTRRVYVMTDEVWDMLMDALEMAIDYKTHYETQHLDDEIEEMNRLIDTVEVREEVVA